MVQASWDDPGTDPGAGNRKAVPNATISSSMMNWILYTIANVDLPDLDGRLGNAETELQNARGSAASLDARLDAFLNEDGTPKKSQLEQGGAHELVGIVLQGTDASKPAASVAGRFWLSTDTKAFYYDDGTQWVLIGKLGGLDLSNHGARHKAGGPDAILPDTIANVLTDHDLANHTALGLEETANKGVANGYCELDANALVPVSRIPSLTRSKISDFFSSPFWGNIPDKPSTFPPSAHTHVKSEITDFPAIEELLYYQPYYAYTPSSSVYFGTNEYFILKTFDSGATYKFLVWIGNMERTYAGIKIVNETDGVTIAEWKYANGDFTSGVHEFTVPFSSTDAGDLMRFYFANDANYTVLLRGMKVYAIR